MYKWNNYKNNGRKYQEFGTCMQQHLFEHFSEEENHSFLEDVFITFIDKTDPSNPLQRKLLEKYSEDNGAMGTEH